MALGDLVLAHHDLIPQLAGFFKELLVENGGMLGLLMFQLTERIEKTIGEKNKVKENELRLWLSMFEAECYLLDIGMHSFGKYIELISEQLMYRNEANDTMLMLTFQKFFKRMRREEPKFFNLWMEYIRKLKNDQFYELCGDLSYEESFVNPGIRRTFVKIAIGTERYIMERPCLTFNALTQAKFFLKSVLADRSRAENYCTLLHTYQEATGESENDNDFRLGFGWFTYHLNILCSAKLKEFYPQGRYYPENFERIGTEGDEAQALMVVIMELKDLGLLSIELKKLLEIFKFAVFM